MRGRRRGWRVRQRRRFGQHERLGQRDRFRQRVGLGQRHRHRQFDGIRQRGRRWRQLLVLDDPEIGGQRCHRGLEWNQRVGHEWLKRDQRLGQHERFRRQQRFGKHQRFRHDQRFRHELRRCEQLGQRNRHRQLLERQRIAVRELEFLRPVAGKGGSAAFIKAGHAGFLFCQD